MMILWIKSRFLALIAHLTVSFRHVFEIKMQLKEVIVLKSQKNVYQIEEDDGELIFGLNKINKHSITPQCRNRVCLDVRIPWACSRARNVV